MKSQLLKQVEAFEREQLPIAYVPVDGSTHIEGHGYRVAIVYAGGDGLHLTGDWPYTGEAGQKMPWFWGPTLKDAKAVEATFNAGLGVTVAQAACIVGRSMVRGGLTAGARSPQRRRH